RASRIAHRASRIAHRASRIAHRASRIAHRASRIAHRASRIAHPHRRPPRASRRNTTRNGRTQRVFRVTAGRARDARPTIAFPPVKSTIPACNPAEGAAPP
ncbi:hypothetical protein, partial [Burkholderia thailandensis]